ncbi:MAG: RNA polymerase factor sigma-54 [Lawsonibacter sp.]|jgi:RNA polymerase sigma-54 factor|nr:RNA polymerase factor sigma-54 [Lawsonibacter sp.]
MELKQSVAQKQKLSLTPRMRQSLEYLQVSLIELDEMLREEALSNPLLIVRSPSFEGAPPVRRRESSALRSQAAWDRSGQEMDPLDRYVRDATFQEHLEEQLGQFPGLDREMLWICRYLVGCLDERGYLDCALEELEEEIHIPYERLEQALFVIQMLDPPGVGARSLSECLTLQLAQGDHFDELTLHIIQSGLESLAKGDRRGLCKRFSAEPGAVAAACDTIRSLSPIPSRGFRGREQVPYVVPDALISRRGGKLTVELDHAAMPQVEIDLEYAGGLADPSDQEVQRYIQEHTAKARQLIGCVDGRYRTLLRLLHVVTALQRDLFLGGDLRPMTMQQVAGEMGLNVSTVSRAVKDKWICFEGRCFPLRELFTAAVPVSEEGISAQMVKRQIWELIREEDRGSPLSDEQIRAALEREGIQVSRRAVAKYRSQLQIPASSMRRGREVW